ncbi:MAG: alpha/beta hydrolase [Candidatus Aenigmatarchaeota archaeon]
MPYLKSADDYKIYYNYVKGDPKNPTIFFVHGWLVNWTCFKEEIRYFRSNGYPVLYMDMRGHGKSDKPDKLESYSLDLIVKDLDAILNREKIRHVVLVGHSMGGMVVLLFCIRHQDKIKKLIIIDSSYKNPLFSPKITYFSSHKKFANLLCSFIIKHTKIKNTHFSHVKDMDFSKMKSYSDQRIALSSLINTPMHSCFCALKKMFDFNVEKDLGKIKKPVLIIASRDDQLFALQLEKAFSRKIKSSRLKVEEGTHSIIIKEPGEISREIRNFLEKS